LAEEDSMAEEIIRAFLLGVARGAAEQFPTAEQAGESIGRRVTGGRSRGDALKAPKKLSKYRRTYKKNLKKVESKYKLKNGSWKKDGFQRAVKEAHAMTRKELGLPKPKKK
jgi:hypothetical protein